MTKEAWFPAQLSPLPHLLLLESWGSDWKGGALRVSRVPLCAGPEQLSDGVAYRTPSYGLFLTSLGTAGINFEFWKVSRPHSPPG